LPLSVYRLLVLQQEPKLGRTKPSTGPRVWHSWSYRRLESQYLRPVQPRAWACGCKKAVHARCCHWLTTRSAFCESSGVAHGVSKWRWVPVDHSWHS